MYKYLALAIAVVVTTGCVTDPGFPAFGDSVRSMRYLQTANPETIANPDAAAVEGFSGVKGEKVIAEHNENVSRPADTTNVINFSIGGDSN